MKEIIYTNKRSILETVKEICLNHLLEDDFAVDMTIGNGYDTLFLASLLNKGMVFGFDIQEKAIENTTHLLEENKRTNYKLFLESHEHIDKKLFSYKNKINLILFNLGYLPNGNKEVMTNHKSTLNAFKSGYYLLKKEGLILIVFYPHEEGKKESSTVLNYLNEENINYTEYHNTKNTNAPFLVVIRKEQV